MSADFLAIGSARKTQRAARADWAGCRWSGQRIILRSFWSHNFVARKVFEPISRRVEPLEAPDISARKWRASKLAGKIKKQHDFPRLFDLKLGIAIPIPIPINQKIKEAIPIPTCPDPIFVGILYPSRYLALGCLQFIGGIHILVKHG